MIQQAIQHFVKASSLFILFLGVIPPWAQEFAISDVRIRKEVDWDRGT